MSLKIDKAHLRKRRKAQDIIGFVCAVLCLAALGVFISGILRYDTNRVLFITGIVSFCIVLTVTLVVGTVSGYRLQKITQQYILHEYGPVREEDRALAAQYLDQWNSYLPRIKKWNFAFLDNQEYEGFERYLQNCLRWIGKGVKPQNDPLFDDLPKQLANLAQQPETDSVTQQIITIYDLIYALLYRNVYDLEDEAREREDI